MLKGIFLIAAVAIAGVITHRKTRLEEKVFKRVPLGDWLTIVFFPILFYIGWFTIVRNIVLRPRIVIFPLEDVDLLALNMLFFAFAFAGNGLHFTGKILWRYLKKMEHSLAFQINEMFHGRLGHYLVYLNSIFVFFMLPLIEINHPVRQSMDSVYILGLIFGGILLGMTSTKAIFFAGQWFGGYNKPLFFLTIALVFLLVGFTRLFDLNYRFYPVNVFVSCVLLSIIFTYLLRMIGLLVRLEEKRRLRFLARFLQIG